MEWEQYNLSKWWVRILPLKLRYMDFGGVIVALQPKMLTAEETLANADVIYISEMTVWASLTRT